MGGPLKRVNNIRAAVGSLGELSSISGLVFCFDSNGTTKYIFVIV